MPTKLVFDIELGEVVEVELEGDELAAHETLIAGADPEPGQTNAERFDAVIENAQAALEAASTLPQVKSAFSATLDGLKEIYGTGGGA